MRKFASTIARYPFIRQKGPKWCQFGSVVGVAEVFVVHRFGEGSPSIFVNEPPEFTIGEDGIARIRVTSGNGVVEFCCTPHVLLAGSSRAMRAYVEWDAKERPEPIPIKKP